LPYHWKVLVNIIKGLRKYVSIRFYNFLQKPKLWNLAKLYKKKAPKKGREIRNKGQAPRTKVQASKQPKRGGPQGGKGTTKNRTLQNEIVCEIWRIYIQIIQNDKGKANFIKFYNINYKKNICSSLKMVSNNSTLSNQFSGIFVHVKGLNF
jgi:hypothetical protein